MTRVEFEYSPGRGVAKYTIDRTAFDVYVEHATPAGGRGFIGLEVKYHEALNDQPAAHRARYDEVTGAMQCFKPACVDGLRRKPVEQIWRDHMLAGSMLLDPSAGWETGLYGFLYPGDNDPCRRAVQLYGEHLLHTGTFEAMTLERFCAALEGEADAAWAAELRERYLGWHKIEARRSASR